VAEVAVDLKTTFKTASNDPAEEAHVAAEEDMTAKQITKIDTTFNPAMKSTTQDPKLTRTARRDRLPTVDEVVREAAGAEVAEAAEVSKTGKAQDQCATIVETKSSRKTRRK
jgi:hypothetical protein